MSVVWVTPEGLVQVGTGEVTEVKQGRPAQAPPVLECPTCPDGGELWRDVVHGTVGCGCCGWEVRR